MTTINTQAMNIPTTRTLLILAMQDVQLLDVSGPLDVFAEANAQAGEAVYRLRIVATAPGPVRSSSGARLLPDYVIGDAMDAPIDTLLVAGTPNTAVVRPDPNVVTSDAWRERQMDPTIAAAAPTMPAPPASIPPVLKTRGA